MKVNDIYSGRNYPILLLLSIMKEESIPKLNKKEQSKTVNTIFRNILDPHKLKLYNYIHKSLNFSEEADDVYQETLLRALKYFRTYRKDKPFSAWIFAIAHNEIQRHIRNIRPLIQLNPDKQPTIPGMNFHSVLIREVFCYAESLTPKQREVFFLFYDSGFSITEISRITGLSNGHIKINLYRARKFLKLKLGEAREKTEKT